jgi:hemolysin III
MIKIKDPISGLSHLIGAILSIIGTIALIYLTKEDAGLPY